MQKRIIKIIENASGLEASINQLRNSEFLAIDTEFARNTNYYPSLCLIQIATLNYVFIIDCLKDNIDFGPLWSYLEQSRQLKVIHSAEQDLQAFYYNGNIFLDNVFDTQLVAPLVSLSANISYQSMVENVLGVKIDKKYQASNWTKRPLTEGQIRYACDDVAYLYDVFLIMRNKLIHNHNFDKAIDINIVHNEKEFLNPNFSRLIRKVGVDLRDKSMLNFTRKLVIWREDIARGKNTIRGNVLTDGAIKSIVSNNPLTLAELMQIKGISLNNVLQDNKVVCSLIDIISAHLAKEEIPPIL